MGYFANQCPDLRQCPTPTLYPNNLQILTVGHKSQGTMDATQVRACHRCYNYGEKGYYADRCSKPRRQYLIQQAKEKEKLHLED
jgi:hypothetical protein